MITFTGIQNVEHYLRTKSEESKNIPRFHFVQSHLNTIMKQTKFSRLQSVQNGFKTM